MSKPLSVKEALNLILTNCEKGNSAVKDLSSAMNHVLAESIFSDRDLPPFNRAAVDGFAVSAEELNGGTKTFKIKGTILAGSKEKFIIHKGDTVHVMTGAAVPVELDSMVMVEVSTVNGDTVALDKESVAQWENISRRAEDAKQGDLLVPEGVPVDSSMIHIAASCGKPALKVIEKPTVSLVSTGDELVAVDEIPQENQIRDSSSWSIEILLKNLEMKFRTRVRVKDSEKDIFNALKEGLNSDILIVTGGVSMGVTDLVPGILEKLGVEKIFHKVWIKPGLPLWFGKTKKGTAVFGLPGNPVSSQVSFKTFVEPYIRKFSGLPEQRPLYLPLVNDKIKKHPREEYGQAKLVNIDGKTFIEPIKHHGSGDFVNLLGSDGVMVHPADVKEIKKGEYAAFYFWKGF